MLSLLLCIVIIWCRTKWKRHSSNCGVVLLHASDTLMTRMLKQFDYVITKSSGDNRKRSRVVVITPTNYIDGNTLLWNKARSLNIMWVVFMHVQWDITNYTEFDFGTIPKKYLTVRFHSSPSLSPDGYRVMETGFHRGLCFTIPKKTLDVIPKCILSENIQCKKC
jgi:hypothetical protein